ncbi:MAG: metallophosphoesterase [Candidatus Coatesbacteria bacterium]|nr:metallophosphoesterase [Candidatus Coatesbacteria bacterium]
MSRGMDRTNQLVLWVALLLLSTALISTIAFADGKCGQKTCKGNLHTYPMRFVVLGDRTGGHVPGIFGQIVSEAMRLHPDFVVNVGDMIEGYTEDETKLEEMWLEFKKLIEPIPVPVYLVPGNHDIGSDGMVSQYEKHIGKPDYSFDVRGVHFVMLDTGRYEKADELRDDQIEWLKKDLEEHKDACYTVAILHKPFWITTVAKGKPDRLHDMFVKYGVDAVFTGHYHFYFAGEYDGIKYTSVGSSGGGTEYDSGGLLYHFVWATFDGKELSLAPIRMDGVLGWDHMTGNDFLLISRIESGAIGTDKAQVRDDLKVGKTELKVKIENLYDKAPIEDVIKWEVPAGWEIKPAGMQIKVPPGESFDAEFTVRCKGPLYPVPSFKIKCPYREGRTAEVEGRIGVSRTALAKKAKSAPTIDGKLSESIWTRPTTTFFKNEYAENEAEPIEFYFAYDRDNLYLGAKCMERKMEELKASMKNHDDAIFGEDCIGYFFQTVDDGPVYQIYASAIGTMFDQKIEIEDGSYDAEKTWNGEYEVKTHHGSDFWSIEIRVPLKQLGTDGVSGKKFALNFRRKHPRLRTTADWQLPISYFPETFGVLELE